MKIITRSLACLSLFLTCHASEVNEGQEFQIEYYNGYTLVTVYNYHVKIIAEQRYSDKLVQIAAIPQQENVGFRIRNVNFETVPVNRDPGGPVAKVHGLFLVRMGFQHPTRIPKVISVKVAFVDEFSISADEALMQGVVTFQKQMPKMLSQ